MKKNLTNCLRIVFVFLFVLNFFVILAYAEMKNVAPQGTAYVWYSNTDEFSDQNKRIEPELLDGDIDSVIWLNSSGNPLDGDIPNAWEAAGVVWDIPRSDIRKFVYTHGPFDGGGLSDGAFTKNFHIQITRDGTTWENINIDPEPTYVYYTNQYQNEGSEVSDQDFVFEGHFGTVKGIRVLGQVRTDNGQWWGSYVSTCRQIWAYKSVGPYITKQPTPKVKKVGEIARFCVKAEGADTIIYQWFHNGEPILDATDSVYFTPPLRLDNDGDQYFCLLSDSTGNVASDTVTLTIYSGNDLLLARDGVFYYRIYYGATENEIVAFAAKELKNYLEKITGSEITLTTDPNSSDKLIIVGRQNPLTQLHQRQLAIDSIKYDGFRIKSIGDTLFIVGAIERGTLYGVYTFLDQYLGVRWYGPDLEKVPFKDIILLKAMNDLQNPAFIHREVFNHDTDDGYYRQRNRLNGNRMHRSYFSYDPGINSWSNYAPIDGNNFERIISPAYQNGGQVLAMSEGCRSEATQYFISKIRDEGDQYWYSFSQNDNGWDPDEASLAFANAHGGALSAPIVDMVTDVANRVRQVHPNAKLATLAYQWSFKPPTGLTIPDYVMIEIAPIEADFGYPFAHKRNAEINKGFGGWNALAKNIIVWDYRANFQNYLQPIPNIYSMCEDIQYLAHLENVKGYFQEGAYNTSGAEFSELRAWVASRLLWKPDQDYRALIDEFIEGYYGPAAEYIKQYVNLLEQSFRSSGERISSKQSITSKYLNLDFILQADQLMAQADAAASGMYSQHVHRIRMGIDMTILLKEHIYQKEAQDRGIQWIHDPNRRARFEQYANEAGVSNFSEDSSIDALYAAMDIKRVYPDTPSVVTGGEEWIDFQDLDFNVCCGAVLTEDQKASDHGAAKLGNEEWAITLKLDLLPPEKEWILYAYVRVDVKSGADANSAAFNMGVWPGSWISPKVSEVKDGKYHVYKFPNMPVKYQTGSDVWFSCVPATANNIYVDRIVAVNAATVGIQGSQNLPYIFDLKQNYPNPFNPWTKIVYSIPETSKVNLVIYNILGQKVAHLVNKVLPAGQYAETFYAEKLPSGLYFCQLTALGHKNYNKTIKMMLLK